MTAGLYVETGRDPSHAMGRGIMSNGWMRRGREGKYVTKWVFAHGAGRNATVAGDGTRAVSTWVGETLRRNRLGGGGGRWVC